MHVLILLSRIEKSGVALHTLDLVEGLRDKGHKITLITGGITDSKNPYLVSLNQRFIDLGIEIKLFRTPKGNPIKKALSAIGSIWQIIHWIRTLPYDVIHSQSPYMTFLPWLARKKFVSTVHNVQLKKNIKFKTPTHFIAISEESKTYASRVLGAKSDCVSVICHGVSSRFSKLVTEEQKAKTKLELGIPQDHIVIGFVGRIAREKGLDVLIRAISNHISPEKQAGLQLVFLGDYFGAEDKIWLESAISDSSIENSVKLIPFQDPKPIYDVFDIFVLPSVSEAFGLVCVEAMMSGNCVIRTDTNGAKDQIIHRKTGFIFPVGDENQLSTIINELLDNNELRLNVARMGHEFASEEFTIEAMTAKTLEVYKKLI